MNYMLNNLLMGKFEFKKGNTLAFLAEALHVNFDSIFMNLPRPYYELHTGNNYYFPNNELTNYGSNIYAIDWYYKFVKSISKLTPFYQYYFDHYSPQKKVVVMSMMTYLRVYDEKLYSNFTKTLDQLIA